MIVLQCYEGFAHRRDTAMNSVFVSVGLFVDRADAVQIATHESEMLHSDLDLPQTKLTPRLESRELQVFESIPDYELHHEQQVAIQALQKLTIEERRAIQRLGAVWPLEVR